MASDFGTGKTLVVLAIVLGCFAILWPKIFYPMMQTAFAMTSPNVDADGRIRPENADRPPHLHPSSTPSRRERGQPSLAEDIQDKFMMREGRPFPNPQSRQPPKPQAKTGGAMSIVMPIYTVGIVVFFLYTVLKLVFKKPPEGGEPPKKPLIKDFHMDAEYRKFVCQQPDPPKIGRAEKSHRKQGKQCEKITEEAEVKDMDSKDYEIYKLRRKLEETESAMERIIQNMSAVSDKVTKQVQDKKARTTDVRQRRKGRKKAETVPRPQVEDLSDDGLATLEEDLTELISMCRTKDRATPKLSDHENEASSRSEESSEAEAQGANDSEEEEEDDTKPLCKNVKVA